MKNTPEVRRLFDQMIDIAAHLTNGYQIETILTVGYPPR